MKKNDYYSNLSKRLITNTRNSAIVNIIVLIAFIALKLRYHLLADLFDAPTIETLNTVSLFLNVLLITFVGITFGMSLSNYRLIMILFGKSGKQNKE